MMWPMILLHRMIDVKKNAAYESAHDAKKFIIHEFI